MWQRGDNMDFALDLIARLCFRCVLVLGLVFLLGCESGSKQIVAIPQPDGGGLDGGGAPRRGPADRDGGVNSDVEMAATLDAQMVLVDAQSTLMDAQPTLDVRAALSDAPPDVQSVLDAQTADTFQTSNLDTMRVWIDADPTAVCIQTLVINGYAGPKASCADGLKNALTVTGEPAEMVCRRVIDCFVERRCTNIDDPLCSECDFVNWKRHPDSWWNLVTQFCPTFFQ
jgi:hypothetical protein